MRAGIGDDGAEAVDGFVGARRVGRDGDDFGVKAAEKRDEKIEARRIEQEGAITGGAARAEDDGEGAGGVVQFGVGERSADLVAGLEEAISGGGALGSGADPQQIRPCGSGGGRR